MSCNKCHGLKRIRGFNAAGEPDAVLCSCVNCVICEDTKQIVEQDENGRHLPARPCICVEDTKVQRYLADAHIPANYRHMEIPTYDIHNEWAHPSQGEALFRAMEYARLNAREMGGDGILLHGGFGLGKTHLAIGMLTHLIKSQKRPGLFCDCKLLLPAIQDSFDRNDIHAYQIRFPVMTRDIVLLDDLGAGYITTWSQEELAAIIQYRYTHDLPTIITTNCPLADPRQREQRIDRFQGKKGDINEEKTLGDAIGGRAFSRLYEMCTANNIVKLQGADYRKRSLHESAHSWR